MKLFLILFLAAVSVFGVAALDGPPEGKARIVVWGELFGLELNPMSVVLDDNPPFEYKLTQKVVVFDVDPGRHYLTYTYNTALSSVPSTVGVHLAAGQVAYFKYIPAAPDFPLMLAPPSAYETVAKRPVLLNPFHGGSF